MSTIPQYFVQQWDTAIRMEASQKESRLQSCVRDRGMITGESFTYNGMNDDGSLIAENNVRHGDTEWTLGDHAVRVANMRDFFEAMPLDRADIPKMIVNPITGGDYAGLLVAKKNRRVDDIIYRALRGTVTFKDSTTAALPAGQKIAASATGFTKSKLISARKLFRANEADGHNGEELCIAYDSEMLEDILSDTTLTSADFLAVRMLQDGDVSRNWMGFKWTPYNAIENSGGTRFTVAWCKSAVHFGTGFLEGDAGPRRDKKNTQQVSLAASFGAVRTSEKKAVEIAFV